MADAKSARERAVEAAKERARQKVLQKTEEAAAANQGVEATTSQDMTDRQQELTANQQAMAAQQMAESDRTAGLERNGVTGPDVTSASGSAGAGGDNQADAASTGASTREAILQRGALTGDGSSPESQAALDMFQQATSGNFDSIVRTGVEVPEGPITGSSQNTYDGMGRRPSQEDISTVWRTNIDKDNPTIVQRPESPPPASVSPDGTIHIPPSREDNREITVDPDGTTTIRYADDDEVDEAVGDVIILEDDEEDADSPPASTTPSTKQPVDGELSPEEKAALAERLRAISGGVDPRAARRTGVIDYGEGGTEKYVEREVATNYRDRLTGDGDDLVEGGGSNEAASRGTLPDQGGYTDPADDSNQTYEQGPYQEMPSDFGPDTDLSHLVPGGGDTSSTSRSGTDDDDGSSARG